MKTFPNGACSVKKIIVVRIVEAADLLYKFKLFSARFFIFVMGAAWNSCTKKWASRKPPRSIFGKHQSSEIKVAADPTRWIALRNISDSEPLGRFSDATCSHFVLRAVPRPMDSQYKYVIYILRRHFFSTCSRRFYFGNTHSCNIESINCSQMHLERRDGRRIKFRFRQSLKCPVRRCAEACSAGTEDTGDNWMSFWSNGIFSFVPQISKRKRCSTILLGIQCCVVQEWIPSNNMFPLSRSNL